VQPFLGVPGQQRLGGVALQQLGPLRVGQPIGHGGRGPQVRHRFPVRPVAGGDGARDPPVAQYRVVVARRARVVHQPAGVHVRRVDQALQHPPVQHHPAHR